MRFGYHALRWGWQNLSFSNIVDSLSAIGFKGFEIICGGGVWGARGEFLPLGGKPDRVISELSEKELKVVTLYNFGKFIRGVDYGISAVPWHFWWRWRQIPQAAKFANSIGCAKFILGGGYPGLKPMEAMTDKDYQKMASLLNEIGRVCQDYGVQVSYHPHPEPHPYTIQSRSQIDKIFEMLDPDLVSLSLDTGLSAGGMDLSELMQSYNKRINHVHFKDYKDGNFFDLGEGAIDLPNFVETLKSIGYDDWIMIEDWFPSLTQRTPVESARNSYEYICKHFGKTRF